MWYTIAFSLGVIIGMIAMAMIRIGSYTDSIYRNLLSRILNWYNQMEPVETKIATIQDIEIEFPEKEIEEALKENCE